MGVFIKITSFDFGGNILDVDTKFLPDNLDYASINEKELFIRYMGGLPIGTAHCYIESQGSRKLISDINEEMTRPVDAEIYKRKMENVESYIAEECRRLGIERSRHRGNQ